MRLGRAGRFHDVVERQLVLFEGEEHGLLEEAVEAEAAWREAPREDAEELYGDYQLVLEAIGDRLAEIRDHYAASLYDSGASEYRSAFDRAATKRFRRLAAALDRGN